MVELVCRAFAVVLAAFALGLAVGWLAFRSGRRTVSDDEWETTRERAAVLRRQVTAAIEARDDHVGQVRRLQEEAARLQAALTRSWQERESLHERVVALDRERDELRVNLERAVLHQHHLQRRVTELSLAAVRGAELAIPARPGRIPPARGAGPAAPAPALDVQVEGSGAPAVAAWRRRPSG